jgi:hypothetical protein
MEQNKTAKYFKYAIGEIILVVIGILIALQVSEWNTNRKRQQQEAVFLRDLHNEFIENKMQLDTVVSRHKSVYKGSQGIIDLFPINHNTVNIDTLANYLNQMAFRWTFNPQQSTINAITNTSSFDLISNSELRTILQRWTELIADYQEDESAYIRQFENSYVPYLSKHSSLVKNGIKNPKVSLEFVESLEFENTIRLMFYAQENILGKPNQITEIDLVYNAINRIIELTASENYD